MMLRDKWGWPVVTIIGKPITNFIRRIIHINILKTWQYRHETEQMFHAKYQKAYNDCGCAQQKNI